MNPLPSVFVSHGSPMHALHAGRIGRAWAELAARLPKPRAVLVASAHWESALPMVTAGERPETIHDFGGFPRELYGLKYPAPGDPTLATRTVEALEAAGIAASANGCRGLDHGAWVPLRYMYPGADVPVVQVSVQPALGDAHHLRLGEALAPLARDGVLVLGSGHLTHNLGEWIAHVQRHGIDPDLDGVPVEPYVAQFSHWVQRTLSAGDRRAMARWQQLAPHAQRAHPSVEHFLPLLVAWGAAGTGAPVQRLDLGVDSGALAMDAYVFGTA